MGKEKLLEKTYASGVAQMLKYLPAMWETQVRSLCQEDLLEKEMATHSSTPAWKIPQMEEPARLQSMGSQRLGHDWKTSLHYACLKISLYLKWNNILIQDVSASQVTQMIKSLPAVWKTQIRSLGQEDPLEKEMETHSSILA